MPFAPAARRAPLNHAGQEILASSPNTRTIAQRGLPMPPFRVMAGNSGS